MFYPNEFEQGYFPRNGVGWYKVFSHEILPISEKLNGRMTISPTWIAYYSEDDKLQCVEYHPMAWVDGNKLTAGSSYDHRVELPAENPNKCGVIQEGTTLDQAIENGIEDILNMAYETMQRSRTSKVIKMRYVKPETLPERIRRFTGRS